MNRDTPNVSLSLSSPKGGEGWGEEASGLMGKNHSMFGVQRSMFNVPRFMERGKIVSQRQRSTCSAFTLIELMVVIVLIGILSALIIPELKGGYQDALLRSTSRNLVNVFSIASSRAVSMNQLHRVRLDAKTGRYVIEKRTRETPQGDEFAPLKDVSEAEGTLDTRISIQVRTPEQMPAEAPETASSNVAANGPTLDTISFYSDGTADSAELLLRDRQGFRLLLRINSITSRVKILELNRE
jgi:prepilin-type N-terminal cleavage/methylation domain-containing protein